MLKKFLFRLHDSSAADLKAVQPWNVYPSNVYGPFETDEEARTYVTKACPNNKEAKFLLFEGQILTSPPSPLEKPESEKRAPGDEKNWVKSEVDGKERWHCKECGAEILAAQVAHAIHDGPFPLSGSGECEYETVGYCPNCEKKPNYHGTPIRRPSRW